MRAVALGAVLLLLTAAGGSAQVRPGLNELNVNGDISGMSSDGESETMVQLQLRYGRFLSRQLELGGLFSATKFEGEDTFGGVGGFAALHLGAEGAATVPYVGAAVETGFGYEDDNPITFGGMGGLKFFVGEGGALSTEAYLSRTSSGDLDWTNYGVRVGVSIFL